MTAAERIRRVLDLQPGEAKPVGAMTAYFMLLILAFLLGRTVRDALFLANFGIDYLPWMYVGTAVSVSLTSQVYTRIAPRINPRLLGYLSLTGFAAIFVAFRFLAASSGGLVVYSALYLWVEIFGTLALLEFWNLAGEVFEARQAKRLYGLVSAGQVLSNLLCGALSTSLSARWGAENLLWLAAGSLLAIFPLVFWVGRYRSGRRTAKKAPPKVDTADPAYRQHLGYLRSIGAVVALTFLATSLVDFQFKLAAKAAYPGKDELASYFGVFYAAVGTVGFFLQTFFTGRITKAMGVLETLSLMPGFFVVGSLAQVFMPGLAAATATKFSENTLRYSINDPVTQLLYLPLPTNLRLRALALASGTIKPWAVGGAGLVMLALRPYAAQSPALFSWVVFFFCLAWLSLLVGLKRGYLGAVASGAEEARRLVWTRPRLDPSDPLIQETLLRTLREADPEKIDYALTLAEKVDIEGLDECLRVCLSKAGPGRARVLRTLEARRDPKFALDVRVCLQQDATPVTRAAALRALGAVDGDRAVNLLRKYLNDASPIVRAGALEALVLYGGTRGLSKALAGLDTMLSAGDPVMRVLAARIIERTPVPHPFQMLEPLLGDPNLEVRGEVIRALGTRCDEEAIAPLLAALVDPETASAAAEALAKFGAGIVPTLSEYLGDRDRPEPVRAAALKGLALNASAASGDALAGALGALPWALRVLAASALQRKQRLGTWAPGEALRAALTKACMEQIEETAWYQTVAQMGDAGSELLTQALREKITAGELQALRICTLLWPNEQLAVLVRAPVLLDPYKRQLLLEICDNVLGGEIKDELLPFLEGHNLERARALAVRHHELPVASDFAVLMQSGDRWIRACAVWTAHKAGGKAPVPHHVAEMLMDLVEKVLLLKSATLFQHLTGADIEKIAAIVHEARFAAGQPIFEQGDPGDALYIVTTGQVKVHLGDKQIAVLKDRDCFGEMAILDDQPRSASITAVTDVHCLALRREDFFFLLEDHFEIVKSIIRVLTERLRNNLVQAAPPAPAPAAK